LKLYWLNANDPKNILFCVDLVHRNIDICLSRGSIARIILESRSSFNFYRLSSTATSRLSLIICRFLSWSNRDTTERVETPLQLAWRLHNYTRAFCWDPSDYTGLVLRVTQVELNSRLSPRIVRTVWLVRFGGHEVRTVSHYVTPAAMGGSAEVMETCQSYLDLHKFIVCGLDPKELRTPGVSYSASSNFQFLYRLVSN